MLNSLVQDYLKICKNFENAIEPADKDLYRRAILLIKHLINRELGGI